MTGTYTDKGDIMAIYRLDMTGTYTHKGDIMAIYRQNMMGHTKGT